MIKHTVNPGMKFGRYTVIRLAEKRGPRNQELWMCECECGNVKCVYRNNLVKGNSKSCGCYSIDAVRVRSETHKMSNHPIYLAWARMKARCKNKDPHKARSYLDRGITVCDAWMNFKTFYDDMSPTWKDGLWIERTNNNLGYSKENCKWATRSEQQRNTRKNRLLVHDGKVKTMVEWAEIYKIDPKTLCSRLLYGWSLEHALTKPLRQWPGPIHPD